MFVNWFIESSQKFPQRPAVEVNNVQMSYRELGLLSSKVATAIQKQNITDSPIGLLTHRSLATYAGVLGIMFSKNIYLPLNPYFPPNRTQKMIDMVNCRVLIIGNECKDYFLKLLPDLPAPMTFILADATGIEEISTGCDHKIILLNELEDAHEIGQAAGAGQVP